MAYKVKNFRFANGTVYVGNKKVEFDNDGVGEIESEDTFKALLNMTNFHAVEDTEEEPEKDEKPEGEVKPEQETVKDPEKRDDGAVVNDTVLDESGITHDEKVVTKLDEDEVKAPNLVSSDNLTAKELDEKADELGIEVSGTKSEKAKAINDHIIANF